ncbi:MAG: tetratricopeptide repeat protein [Bryobacteraceae bacterium]|nr:tetratricopeptide repeat protein [Bryobacteraceae bacterium]
MISRLTIVALSAAILAAQPKKEEPVGVVLAAAGAQLLRMNTATPLNARTGDMLFAGDGLKTATGAATFLYCPASASQTLEANGEVVLEAKQVRVKSGKLGPSKPVGSCVLPQMVRVNAASQQHYGVSLVRALNKPAEPELTPESAYPGEAKAELSKVDPGDPQAAALARAAIFEKYNLVTNALAEYRRIASEWPEAVWVKGKIFEMEEANAAAETKAAESQIEGGQTFAVLIGVSKYQKLPEELWLQFADSDATVFDRHLRSPRGGGVLPENMAVLTNDKATTAAVRNAFETLLKGRAGKKDTIIILIAGHGTVEAPGSKAAFILTYDSDPQDLASTALPMADMQDLLEEQVANVARVVLFVDVCRAGTIGTIKSTTVNSSVERLAESEGEVFGLMASRPKELSYEGPQFGGGHGAFSYYLLKALEGEADKDKDGIVNVNELIEYVRDQVAQATGDKQHPRDFGTMGNAVPLSFPSKPGIETAHYIKVLDSGGNPALFASGAPLLPSADVDEKPFADAVASGRLLPEQPDNAFDALSSLRSQLSPSLYLRRENQLRIALEDRAQQVLLRYLEGDETPQTKEQFASAAKDIVAATRLTPESLLLDARLSFFRGREILFDKEYKRAADLLERAIRLDPMGAYSYNALGIAYLEQGNYEGAAPAFRDAISRAPHWAYPVHNLALTYFEMGDYAAAIRSYQQAIRLRPGDSYLPYNLGLVYQKLNRRREAEASYRQAMTLAPNSAEPLNALGSLKASTGKFDEAERLYREALTKDPELLPARHNLALLLAERKERQEEAIRLWRANLERAPDHLPSRLGLAELLARRGDIQPAIAEYRAVASQKPDYTAARLALSDLLEKSGDRNGALAQTREALERQEDDPAILERLGDLEAALGHRAEANKAYAAARQHTEDKGARKRLERKLRQE